MASDISGSNRRGISSCPTSMRATRSWTRTRNCRKPHPRRISSHASTRRSFSAEIVEPYGHREDGQGGRPRAPPQAAEPFLLAVIAPVGGVFGEAGDREFVRLHEPVGGLEIPGDFLRLVAFRFRVGGGCRGGGGGFLPPRPGRRG